MNLSDFYSGKEFEAYTFLGAHVTEFGTVFRTYAPAARHVAVIGEFNGWNESPMHPIEDGKFWECYVDGAHHGQMYKYRIYRQDGTFRDHQDPYGFYSELRPGTASVIYDMDRFYFHDDDFMHSRDDFRSRPLNIYEFHMGSWRRKDGYSAGAEEEGVPDGSSSGYTESDEEHEERTALRKEEEETGDFSEGWYRYEEIGEMLIPYLKENGYNCLEFMPLNEYPADESWGYQATGFFSVTSRYGDPDGFRMLIDECHRNGIAVIMDIVTVHFASNDYGLLQYDGTPLYEYPHPAVGKSEWGSSNFMHSSGPVRTFLQSAGDFWLSRYHFDGLRYDAVGNLLYWQGDQRRGENRNAIEFLRTMNAGLKMRHPGIMLIAEDSTAFRGVTTSVEQGGLGFDYKWDLGWMNDTLSYFQEWPQNRDRIHHKLTFSMQYFYNEKYILPLSHDEVVHGKATIMQKMFGLYEGKFPQARALYLYMYTHPGKKLNFMGNELGQLREWDERREQDWFLTKYPLHDSFLHFIRDLAKLYEDHPSLWKHDYDRGGFEWIDADQAEKSVYVFRRRSEEETLFCIFNFSGLEQRYDFHPGWSGTWTLLLDTDEDTYTGRRHIDEPEALEITAEHGYVFVLPSFSARIYQETGE